MKSLIIGIFFISLTGNSGIIQCMSRLFTFVNEEKCTPHEYHKKLCEAITLVESYIQHVSTQKTDYDNRLIMRDTINKVKKHICDFHQKIDSPIERIRLTYYNSWVTCNTWSEIRTSFLIRDQYAKFLAAYNDFFDALRAAANI